MDEDRFDAKYRSIPKDQMDLPVTFSIDGRKLRLRELLDRDEPDFLWPEQLSERQLQDLTADRVAAQEEFLIGMLGVGEIDKDRAIAAIADPASDVGRALLDVEGRTIARVLRRASTEKGWPLPDRATRRNGHG
ncbi:MAG TPA: hypothetical protein VEK15_21600 [Vicinamibacteria bacterium]|nr:hypothetical protein [Vicinamibacteria bacterium]